MNIDFIKKYVWMLVALMFPLGFVACSDSEELMEPEVPPQQGNQDDGKTEAYQDEKAYANFFAYNAMTTYYLWYKEIESAFKSWKVFGDPIEAVQNARYKENGKDVDRWTMMTDAYTEMVSGSDGVATGTYGWGIKGINYVNYKTICAYVTYTHPGSPAEKAGLQRGDMILQINGKNITDENYYDLYDSSSIELGLGTFKDGAFALTGKTIKMDAVDMEEDPILVTKVFKCGSKKVGYLHYTSFTFDSSLGLYEVCKQFKAEGISELILDLRYNGGGYVFTEEVLASMLAPEAEVKKGSVFETQVYNDILTASFKKQGRDLNSYFTTGFKQTHNNKNYDFKTTDANLGLSKIYALVSGSSASASEAILVGLLPYMNIEIIGEQTHGKYCTGIMMKGEEWYQDIVDAFKEDKQNFAVKYPEFADWKKYIADWGIYVMIGRYADKNGENSCMPDGLTPDVEAEDLYEEAYPLGDEREALLHVALQKAGKTDLEPRLESRSVAIALPTGEQLPGKKNFLDGKLIYTGRLTPNSKELLK